MTYQDAIRFLYDLRWFGTKLGLANTFKLASLADNPHQDLRFIHVAGTNGKGSTCAMLESIYQTAGLKVGLFTSPHLVSFGERIQVNRQPISESEVVRLLSQLKPVLAQFPPEEHPTFFEVVTVMALCHFREQKCDLVIWETGLGGRLDATNIVTPLASVITNVDYDHQQWLGENLPGIAFEKAGIIKPGVPVITAAEKSEALEVIQEIARERSAPLIVVSSADSLQPPLNSLELPLAGQHQKLNAALALAVVNTLQSLIPVPSPALSRGLSNVHWPGRLQMVQRPAGQKILLDGAHNLPGAFALKTAIEEKFSHARPALVLGILADKDWLGICRTLAPLAHRILLVPIASERTAQPNELLTACRNANPAAESRVCKNLAEALELFKQEPFVILTGSLYLVGEALELLGDSTARHERSLNEWDARKPAIGA